MNQLKTIVVFFLGITLSSSSQAAEMMSSKMINGRKQLYLSNQVIVKVKTTGANQIKARANNYFGANVIRDINPLGLQVIRVPDGESQDNFIQKLKALDTIEFAEPIIIYRANLSVDDPEFTSQSYLQTSLLNMPQAWDITTGNASVVVAVVDTGLALLHPDISSNLWVNPNPSGTSGLNGTRTEIDWNGNSNCAETDPSAGPEMCAGDDPTDDNTGTFHGTHASGLIAATANNTTNIAGVAFGVRIMAVKALNSSGFGTSSSIADGIVYAVDNGASVINLSLGSQTQSAAITTAVNYAISNNVIVVAAAGNDGNSSPVNFPAATEGVIAVGATNSADGLASFSCTGPEIDLVAPGVSILSLTSPSGTSSLSGTSFAAPLVAGVVALLRSLDANMSLTNVRQYLNFNAQDLGSAGFDNSFGFGRLNAFATINSANGGETFFSNPADPNETFAYPSPFNAADGGNLTISLPLNLGSSGIKIEIFSLSGKLIKTLNNTNQWNGRNDDGNIVGAGLYYYFAKTDVGDIKGKLVITK